VKYRQLGRSGLKVSAVGLGTGSATFAGRGDEQSALAVISEALELGITYFDTAETYAEGRAERLLGMALKSCRADVVIATKFGKDRSVTETEQRGSRTRILKAVEGSLRRLDTDYIDLYIQHEPDPGTPITETLSALDDLQRSGKVRYIGCSGFASWQLVEALWTSRANGLTSFVTAGIPYSLLDRRIERDLVPACQAYGVGIVPAFPLASGFLTGKYEADQDLPPGSRFAAVPEHSAPVRKDVTRYSSWLTDANFGRVGSLQQFARERSHTVTELAIAWLLAQPWLGAIPVGVTTGRQLREDVGGIEWSLGQDDLDRVDELLRSP
jgi:aryl-alcohol dehydrogenase-like predicted oxidoreductase